ncbi:LCP family protein [Actinomadura rupiterrae]|uniref:LCP family protein n=1 Tax=Actinomadura rupiterrae TaxID=559627 RepID=UPI0020A3E35A|nr:LCP family protein [Actinomadura rupiterrae]MCP2343609.1 LCP family protein required for cell wall assembly [Actinomadura rupiterrae]
MSSRSVFENEPGDGDGPRRTGRAWRVLGVLSIVMSVVLVAGSIAAYALWRRIDGQIGRENVTGQLPANRPPKLNNAMNILLIGSDSRAGANARYGTEVAGERSDTTILLHLSPGGDQAIGLSFPRDSMVRIPDCKRKNGNVVPGRLDMINSAFAQGGSACTWATIESLTKIHIDHFVKVDFTGFKRVVDALGGVEICVPRRIDDPKAELHLRRGRQIVHGDQALGYVRTRYVLGDGSDLGRIRRQQQFMASVVKKATDKGMLKDPGRVYGFLSAVAKSIKVDDQFTMQVMRKLATGLQGMSAGKVRFVTVPVEAYPADKNRVQFNQAQAEPLFEAIRHDNAPPAPAPPPPGQGPKGAQGPQGRPVKAKPVPPAQVKVTVLNATSEQGLAGRVGDQLKGRGFQVVKVGGKKAGAHPKTEILFGPGADRQAAALAAALPGHPPRAFPAGTPGMVYLVIGTDGADVGPGARRPLPKVAGEIRADRDVCAPQR